jgi:hypothetical protein
MIIHVPQPRPKRKRTGAWDIEGIAVHEVVHVWRGGTVAHCNRCTSTIDQLWDHTSRPKESV